MDDLEAQRQIKQMVNFILNEAKDKAEEIESSAVEDFNVQKMTLFQQKKDEIRSKLTKKINNLKLEKIRAHNAGSREINDRVLRHQCLIIDDITGEALNKIKGHIANSEKYKGLLVLLILKGAMSLAATDLIVRCRKEDVDVIRQAIEEASGRFEKLTEDSLGSKRTISLSVDTKNSLPSDMYGVVMTTRDGKIECNSTMNSRLQVCSELLIPKFKTELFQH